jgi:hypothetical protein
MQSSVSYYDKQYDGLAGIGVRNQSLDIAYITVVSGTRKRVKEKRELVASERKK